MQVQFNHSTGLVADDQRVPVSGGVPIVYDQWTQIVATFDLDNGEASVTYNDCNIGNGPLFVTGWNPGTGPLQIANLDCFTIDSQIFWDDIILATEATSGPWFNANSYNPGTSSGMNADLNLQGGTGIAAAQTVVAPSTLVSANIEAPLSPVYNAFVDVRPAQPLGFGGTSLGSGQILNMDITSPTGFFLFPFPGLPYGGGQSTALQFQAPSSPLLASIQWYVFDAASPLGISLSAPCELKVR